MRHRHTRSRATSKIVLLNRAELAQRWQCSPESVRERLLSLGVRFHENSADLVVVEADLERLNV